MVNLKNEGTVKIQKKGLKLDSPQRWHFHSLKTDIVFDVDGTAEVPGSIAEKLLSPKYTGEYLLVGVVDTPKEPAAKEELKPIAAKPRARILETKPAPAPQETTTEFVKEIT